MSPYQHADAFRLIAYRRDVTLTRELVWNAGDQPAPKTILIDGELATRLALHAPRLEDHRPLPGSLVLLPQDPTACMQDAVMRAETDEHLAALVLHHENNLERGYPAAVEVTADVADAYGWASVAG